MMSWSDDPIVGGASLRIYIRRKLPVKPGKPAFMPVLEAPLRHHSRLHVKASRRRPELDAPAEHFTDLVVAAANLQEH